MPRVPTVFDALDARRWPWSIEENRRKLYRDPYRALHAKIPGREVLIGGTQVESSDGRSDRASKP
jgi:hypothetical protein